MSKMSEFINKHGYTYKSYFLALVVFPPASLFVVWKIPNASLAVRLLLSALGIALPLLPFILAALGLSELAD